MYKCLRTQDKRYKKRGNTTHSRGFLTDRKPIENRPKIVEKKIRFGDFELDTIIGKNHQGAIVTINDRATGLFRVKKVHSKDSELVEQAILMIQLF